MTADGRAQVFTPAERATDRLAGEARYRHPNELGGIDFLTLADVNYTTSAPNSYVGMGYWQSNLAPSGSSQSVNFYTFTYGYETPATAVPRSGFASWDTDIFGLYTRPLEKTRTMQGSGRLDVDFATNTFATTGGLAEIDVVGTGGQSTLTLSGGGSITSDGHLDGHIVYSGTSGSIFGSFYGPGAQELGASFIATSSAQGVLNGALTGKRNAQSVPFTNITLLNVLTTQGLSGGAAGQISALGPAPAGTAATSPYTGPNGVVLTPAGPSTIQFIQGGIDHLVPDQAQSKANFVRYTGTSPSAPTVAVDFYRPGAGNSELALTYTSFATWRWTTYDAPGGGTPTMNDATYYLFFGIRPPQSFLGGITGTGTYKGVIYGIGSTREGQRWDLGGTSFFEVNFGAHNYSGSLDIVGRDAAGGIRDFGRHSFASTLNGGGLDPAFIADDPVWNQVIQPQFFGPRGEEIGAKFNLLTGKYGAAGVAYLDGITVAKQQ